MDATTKLDYLNSALDSIASIRTCDLSASAKIACLKAQAEQILQILKECEA